jgi:hypothetical protein
MALITGYGGTLTFSGTTVVAVRSFTMNFERASLDVTTIADFRERRIPGRVRRFGTCTLYRQDGNNDNTLRSHLMPVDVAGTVSAVLTLKYTDQGTIAYDEYGAGTGNINVQVTSASFTDDGTGPAMWELSWEEQ